MCAEYSCAGAEIPPNVFATCYIESTLLSAMITLCDQNTVAPRDITHP